MSLITPTQLRAHVDTDLTDTALQRILDDADAEIVRRFGEHTTANVEVHRPGGGELRLFTDRKVASITTIVETLRTVVGEQTVTLSADDYTLESDRCIRRESNGTNSRDWWAEIVTVTYLPVSDDARRTRVTIDLCRLALTYQAAQSMSVGDVSISHVAYDNERERILRTLEYSVIGRMA